MQPARKRPGTRTTSTCTAAEMDRATHSFKIVGSSVHRGFGMGKYVSSATFTCGGYEWDIRYYPDGGSEQSKDYVAVYLFLRTKNVQVKAIYNFRLVHPATGLSESIYCSQNEFNGTGVTRTQSWGTGKFMKKSDLEAQGYLRDESLEIECDVSVIRVYKVDVPPPDIADHLGKLMEWEEAKDVSFNVKGEVFRAHKLVLASRSPVFKAELYGPMRDKRKRSIVVEDMQPPVFKALLHFIYKDAMPAMDDLDRSENEEMVRHLLVAADRYGMERMKLVCESILCSRLDVENVATNLALADQHHCNKLKEICIKFINSSNRLDDVVASKGYECLKRTCPALTVEIWEKSAKSHKV